MSTSAEPDAERARVGQGPDNLAGRTLGDFVVVERLGAGGQGEVWRAEQRTLGREAVIKVLRAHATVQGNAARAQRFLREARLASRLDHPYAAHVYAFGAEPDGLLWIAMERIRGLSLAELLDRQGPLPVERLVPLFERLCEVVQTAHDAGIVHRDLKPENVMVVARAGRLLPKLLDLGIARAFADGDEDGAAGGDAATGGTPAAPLAGADGDRLAGAVTVTHAGELLGSPAFMAPEQWFDPGGVDHRADLYALGVLAYVALTGRLPFDGPTARDVARAHARQPPPPLGPGWPAALDAVLARALAKRRDDRVASALELAAAFRAAAAVSAPPEVPGLPPVVHDAVLSSAPPPVADALAAFDAARDVDGALAALTGVVRATVRWLAVVAVACGVRRADWNAEARAGMAKLRRGALDDGAWLAIARAAVAGVPAELLPVPELARTLADPVLDEALGPGDGEPAARLVSRLAVVERLLRAAGFLLEYPVVVRRGDRVERWAGTRRRRRPAVWVRDPASLELDAPVLLDADGVVALCLAPLALVASPAPGGDAELFLIDRGELAGAVLVSFPDGFETRDDPWPQLALALPDDRDGAAAPDEERCPYRGLEPFGPGDADRFVGREADADAAANRLRERRVLAVVGPSGAGKSSFLLAGVLPRLSGMRTVVLRPGARPMAALAAALGADVGARDLRRLAALDAVVVVDQLEELVTACAEAAERDAFARALGALVDAGGWLAVTVRDDFLLRVAAVGELGRLLEPALQLLATPARAELIRILVEPARRAGYVFDDPTLPESMADAVAGRPGALPLLSFTAARLWRERDRRLHQLTRRAHDALGGVAGALAGHADAVLAALGPAHESLVREAFRNLATAEGTRAVLSRAELQQVLGAAPGAPDRGAGEAVIAALVDARLLVTTDDATGDRIEIVHEALLEAWPRLRRWRQEDAETARLRDQLRAAARPWDERGRPRGLLWRGDALDEYRLWRARYPGALTAREQAFADASLADASRGRLLRRLAVAAVVAGLAVTAVVLTLANREARHQERAAVAARAAADTSAAEARRRMIDLLIEQGRTAIFDDKPMQGLVWLDEAYRQGADPDVVQPLAAGAARTLDQRRLVLRGHQGWVTTAGLTSDGRWAVTGGGRRDQTARIWDAATGVELARVATSSAVFVLELSPVGAEVALGSEDGRVRIVALPSGEIRNEIDLGAPVIALRYAADGALVASTSSGMVAVTSPTGTRQWRVSDVAVVPVWLGDEGLLTADLKGRLARWSADGSLLAEIDRTRPVVLASVDRQGRYAALVGRADPVVDIYDVRVGRRLVSLRHGEEVDCATITPDGRTVATGAHDGSIKIWDLASGSARTSLEGHEGPVTRLAFTADGKHLITGSSDGTARVWDVVAGTALMTLHHHVGEILDLRIGAGAEAITAGIDGSAAIWRPVGDEQRSRIALGDAVGAAAVWLGEDRVAISDATTRVRLYATNGELERTLNGSPRPLPGEIFAIGRRRAVAVDASRRLLAAPQGGAGVAWDTRQGAEVARCALPRGEEATAVALSSSGRTLATGSHKGVLVLCDLDAASTRRLDGHAAPIRSLAISPDGRWLASTDDFRAAKLWDLRGDAVVDLVGHNDVVTSIPFSPRDALVATAGLDGTVRVWTMRGTQVSELHAAAGVNALAWSRRGDLVAVGQDDGHVTLWHVAARRRVAGVGSMTEPVTSVEFSSDDQRLLTAAGSHVASWDIATAPGTPAAVTRRMRCLPYVLVDGDVRARQVSSCASAD